MLNNTLLANTYYIRYHINSIIQNNIPAQFFHSLYYIVFYGTIYDAISRYKIVSAVRRKCNNRTTTFTNVVEDSVHTQITCEYYFATTYDTYTIEWIILWFSSLSDRLQSGVDTYNGPLGYLFSPRTTQVTKLGSRYPVRLLKTWVN